MSHFEFRVHPPSSDVQGLIHHYEWFEIIPGEEPHFFPVVPSFISGLIFLFFHGPPTVINPTFEESPLPQDAVLSTLLHFTQNRVPTPGKGFRVVYQPGGLFEMYGIPVMEFQEVLVSSQELDPNLRFLREQMAEDLSFVNCIKVFESYLRNWSHYQGIQYLFPQLMHVLAEPNPQKSIRTVAELADHLGKSHRHLYRLISQQMGFSPKQLLKVHRFLSSVEMMRQQSPNIPLVEIALTCGYVDQAHFSREFKQMLGQSPGKFRKQFLNLNQREQDIMIAAEFTPKGETEPAKFRNIRR